ncbi:hypothetical protein AHAS_Ahas19G0008200 [Arachis hypogaea]
MTSFQLGVPSIVYVLPDPGSPDAPDLEGLIPPSLEQIFQTSQSLKDQGWKYKMQASILEIYNETIRDLLSNRPCGIDQTDNSVPDLTIVDVCSVNEVSSLLKQAAQCRFVGRTQMNEQSSRSHFVLTLRICGINEVDSVEKLDKLLAACKALGVETQPMVIGELGIIPLFSWYHEACKDFHACKWPQGLSNGDMSLSMYFDAMNDKQLEMMKEVKIKCDHIITFSHFVPRQELCPEKRMLFYPKLPKIIGSDSLENRIRSIHGAEGRKDASSACHVLMLLLMVSDICTLSF